MAANTETLFTMSGAVRQLKANASFEFTKHSLNARIRQVIDMRPYWADLGETRILSCPDAYTTGTVTLTSGSRHVTGASTLWTVSDVVDTNIPDGVEATGYVKVYPASMTGITAGSILYVDASGVPEAVSVVELREDYFIAQFQYLHNAGCTLTQSSYAGRQFRAGTSPVFTVMAVHTTTELELDNAWGAAAASAQSYRIYKCYYDLGADVRMIHDVMDPVAGLPVARNISQDQLNLRDPQRSQIGGNPLALADYRVGSNGAMLYELWPAPTTARQVSVLLSRQWPKMENRDDRPPFFINPQVIIDGATADALRQRVAPDDPYFNPRLADTYEMKFMQGMVYAANADSTRHSRDYQTRASRMMPMPGADWQQTHIPDVGSDYEGGCW